MVPRRGRFPTPSYQYLRMPYRGRGFTVPRPLLLAAVAVGLLLYVFQFVFGDKGVLRRMELEREVEKVRLENTRLALQKDRLLQEVQLKENDPLSLEKLAREKYWMIGPNEQIYRFVEDEVVPDAGAAGPVVGGADAGTAAGAGEAKPK